MKIVRFRDASGLERAGVWDDSGIHPFEGGGWGSSGFGALLALPSKDLRQLGAAAAQQPALAPDSVTLLAPIDRHEVWAAGVTYLRSKVAREEESAGASRFYDDVYEADRPELFFKATPARVVGPGAPIRVRTDSCWSVPEPELAILLAPDLRIVGYTLGNDVSARDIEGRNPLYLPQAKVYDACCALGPHVLLAEALPPLDRVEIHLAILRGGRTIFEGSTTLARMRRGLRELVDWLARDNRFPEGAVLLTGTGIVPPDDLTLEPGDRVEIRGTELGLLANPVVRGPA